MVKDTDPKELRPIFTKEIRHQQRSGHCHSRRYSWPFSGRIPALNMSRIPSITGSRFGVHFTRIVYLGVESSRGLLVSALKGTQVGDSVPSSKRPVLRLRCAYRMSMLDSRLESENFLSGKDLARRGPASSICVSRPSRMCRSTSCKPLVLESSCGGSFCSRLHNQHTLASSYQRSRLPW